MFVRCLLGSTMLVVSLGLGKVVAQSKQLPQLAVTRIKVGESYKTDGGANVPGVFGNTWARIIQVIDDNNMLVGIDNGTTSPGGRPRYSVVVWCKFPTKGLTDGKKGFLSRMIGTNQVTATGTKRYRTVAGGTRTVFVLEAYKKKKSE